MRAGARENDALGKGKGDYRGMGIGSSLETHGYVHGERPGRAACYPARGERPSRKCNMQQTAHDGTACINVARPMRDYE